MYIKLNKFVHFWSTRLMYSSGPIIDHWNMRGSTLVSGPKKIRKKYRSFLTLPEMVETKLLSSDKTHVRIGAYELKP